MTDHTFVPGRLRLARDLYGWSQAELARRSRLTAPALSQFEAGTLRPAPSTEERLADTLAVPTGFFALPLLDTHDGFFRSLRRTSVTDRRRARAIAHIAHDLATNGAIVDALPVVDLPYHLSQLTSTAASVERIADDVRRYWGIGAGPLPNVVDVLEAHGVVVIRPPLASADVDAFSLPFSDRPVVVLGADKNDRARSRFDAAHELGHLVMHGEQVWGLPAVEREAHQFAAAFLMPLDDIVDELPGYGDWPRLFALKRKWQVSLAALLMRARSVGRMSDANYLTAIKAASARGWRRKEPVPIGRPETPHMLTRALRMLDDMRLHTALPASTLEALAAGIAE